MQSRILRSIMHASNTSIDIAAAAAAFLHQRWAKRVDTVVVTGSGFAFDAQGCDVVEPVSYAMVPGMPAGHVEGHAHVFRVVRVHDRYVLLCAGRFHLYEGHSVDTCGILVDIARHLGCQRSLLMNAVGALNPSLNVGDVVLVSDVLDLTFSPAGTAAAGKHSWNVSQDWNDSVLRSCREYAIHLNQGVLAQVLGPSYETRAEIRMLRRLGADIVGMSTVIEAYRACRSGLETTVLSLVTNTLSDVNAPILQHQDVVEAARSAHQRLQKVMSCALA